jgi:hypothetical protein
MERVNLNSAPAAVREFVRNLPKDPNGVELELDGNIVGKFVRPQQPSEGERQALLDRVMGQLERSHQRNSSMSAKAVEEIVRAAVDEVRDRQPK